MRGVPVIADTSSRATWEVPAFDARVFREKRTRYCVIVPVINEGGRLQRQLGRMQPFAHLADVAIADGGSSDGSVDRIAILVPYVGWRPPRLWRVVNELSML